MIVMRRTRKTDISESQKVATLAEKKLVLSVMN